jgi:cyclopropane fatty-acyl-phospholipid synthase-like methyltransferase
METPRAPYHPTPPEMAREMLKAVDLKPGETLYDLGCGEGNILLVGAEEFGAKCVGIEIDPDLVEKARKAVKRRGLEDRVKIICGDLFSPEYWAHLGRGGKPYAVRNADVLTLYLSYEMYPHLIPMLEKELKPGTRIVSFEFYIRGWEEVKDVPRMFIYEAGKSY